MKDNKAVDILHILLNPLDNELYYHLLSFFSFIFTMFWLDIRGIIQLRSIQVCPTLSYRVDMQGTILISSQLAI